MPPKKATKKGKKEEKVVESAPTPKPSTPAPVPSPSPAPTRFTEPNEQPLPVLLRSHQGSSIQGSFADDDFYGEPADVTPIGHGHAPHSQEQFVERFDEYGEVQSNNGTGWRGNQHAQDDDFGDTAPPAGGWGNGGGWGTPTPAGGTGRNSGLNQGGWGQQSVAESVHDDWESPSQPLDQARRHPTSPAPPPNVATPPPQPATEPHPAPTTNLSSANPPQPSAEQPPHPLWGPYPPPSDAPKKYVSASEMAKKREASQIPPPVPQSQPPPPPPPQQQPNFYPPHPGRPMPPPAGSRASQSASASIYTGWGHPKNVDLWGDPKPNAAPPPPPPPKGSVPFPPPRQAWQDWGRPPASRSVSGQSAPPPPRPYAAAHAPGWGYEEEEDYSDDDDESDESDEEYGWPQPTPSAWRTQGQGHGRHQSQPTRAKPKVTFSSPVASDAGGTTRNVLSEQQHGDLYSSLLNTLPQSQLSAHTPKVQQHPHQRHQSFHGQPHPMHGHPQAQHGNTWHQHPHAAPPKHGKPKKSQDDWGDGGWNDEGSGWGQPADQGWGQGHGHGHGGHGGGGGGGWGQDAGGNEDWGHQGNNGHGGGDWGNQNQGGWGNQGGWDAKSAKKSHKKDTWGQNDNSGWGNQGGWPEEGKSAKGKKDKKGSNAGWGTPQEDTGGNGAADDWGQPSNGGWGQPAKGAKGTGSGWRDDWGQEEEEEEEEWEDEDGYDDPWEDARRIKEARERKTSWGDGQGEAAYSMPSKTMTHAYNGTYTQPIDAPQTQKMNEYTDIQFLESSTQAFGKVSAAFFGRSRKAKERIHWMFSSQKDARVVAHINWITKVEYDLGSYGLHKFLQTRERGALFTNVLHRLPGQDSQPTFDWLTFKQVQSTLDPVLQDSVIGYDPAMFVYVFVFLPSESGNSVAMWRRKVLVPNNTRLRFQQEIAMAVSGLQNEKEYKMMLDQPLPQTTSSKSPPKPEPKAPARKGTLTRKDKVVKHKRSKSLPNVADGKEKKKKRKWWQVLRFAD